MAKGDNIDAVLEKLKEDPAKIAGVTSEEAIEIEVVDPEAAASSSGDPDAPVALDADPNEWPAWAKGALPSDLKLPEGKVIFALRFRAGVTDKPKLGDRVCILWNLTESDEKHASKRARGDSLQVMNEMAKQMIRAIDGHKSDWSAPGRHNPATFFTDIGGKCRTALKSWYAKTHMFSAAEQIDFFAQCVAVRSVTG